MSVQNSVISSSKKELRSDRCYHMGESHGREKKPETKDDIYSVTPLTYNVRTGKCCGNCSHPLGLEGAQGWDGAQG